MNDESMTIRPPERGIPWLLIGAAAAVVACLAVWYVFLRGPGYSMPPIASAAAKGDLNRIQHLLTGGADPNERDGNGTTPLHHALMNGHTDAADALCVAGARLDVRNSKGETLMQSLQASTEGLSEADRKKREKSAAWLKQILGVRSQPRQRPSIGGGRSQ